MPPSQQRNLHLPLFPSGVGSTHHRDPQAAVGDVLRLYARMPFWPQLPHRSEEERILPQVGLDLPGAAWDGKTLRWSGEMSAGALENASAPPPERAAGLAALLAALTARPEAERPPLVKGQLVGPLTLSMVLRDAQGRAPHNDDATMRWLGRFVGRAGAAQARLLRAAAPGVLVVLDEPGLASLGEPRLPLAWRTATEVLREALAPIQATGALAGVHSCAPLDWTRALAARPHLIHFDGREAQLPHLLQHRSALREHVARGGFLGWGLWPTDAPDTPWDPRAVQSDLARAAREIAFVDASMGTVFKRSFLSGVCGSAGFSAAQEERMAAGLEEVSMGIRRRYWIAETTDTDPDHPLT